MDNAAAQAPPHTRAPSAAATCGSCQAPIFWAVTDNARRMPLDAPDRDGNVAVRADKGVLYCHVLQKGQEPASYETTYRPHWATCPNPPRRRGKGGRRYRRDMAART
jgi:hypothetical protein